MSTFSVWVRFPDATNERVLSASAEECAVHANNLKSAGFPYASVAIVPARLDVTDFPASEFHMLSRHTAQMVAS